MTLGSQNLIIYIGVTWGLIRIGSTKMEMLKK